MKSLLSSRVLRVLIWSVAFVAAIGSAAMLMRRTAERLLADEAEHAALQYAGFIAGAVPRLNLLFDQGSLEPETLTELRRLRRMGDVFRFQLFDRDGRALLSSEDLAAPEPRVGQDGQALGKEHHPNKHVSDIVLGGRNFIELHGADDDDDDDDDEAPGAGAAARPPVYSEAYVPVMAGDRVLGVVEVYVDQAGHAARIRAAFAKVSAIVVALLLAIGGAMGAQAWQRLAERRRVQQRMRYLAEHDPLSGALNRASFHQALEQAGWRHGKGGAGFAVLCIDLDHFKEINDARGHAAGDEVLRQAAARLAALVRHGDLVARLGGDEFAVLQSAVNSPEDVGRLAQRVVDAIALPFELSGHTVLCGASVGAARFGVDAHAVDELLHKADVAMYRAKTGGRSRFSFYDAALDRELAERRSLAQDLRSALADGHLAMHYQPLWANDGTTLLGYEALMRWRHPQRGMVPPAEFIPLAEQTGQIEALGAWALQRACLEAASWPAPLHVAVNLSPAQFRPTHDLVRVVEQALEVAGLSAHRLELEITESLLMSGTDEVLRTLGGLSAMGVRIAMDDFGTGYSSLAYLWRFPFDKIKIDRAFTSSLVHDAKVALIVRSIVSLAHAMGMRVNAEGVETEPQMAMLQSLGCDELQGYLLGRPGPAEALDHRKLEAVNTAAKSPAANGSATLLSGAEQ
ncbi:MAG TPA: bifunctional diguanylate cyclase/phosphodiesterase [Ideonella sp.]|uniref:putative bifunctional diguanylate cyclase/phosphodiesterase n=1 Tax=Ideonella sp. TaxID=1929293 RepID=UPI002C827BA7|nr:bifunctional diguanylate cyclase/phosphodiesterase [Ideonella sp.]HSI51280.1 bifunctional diguanylate cyclase/phosphodiesterase [Ideonella sp.]